ncbi:MAG: ATP-binding protein [Planctomycetes bacterium]|nr:ATP-binding protein [Planctomycetota bacterium]
MADNPASASDPWRLVVELPSERGSNRLVTDPLLAQLGGCGWPEADVFAIHLAVEEAITNAIVHGNMLDPDKKVRVSCEVSPDRVLVSIVDEGSGFDPASVPDCTADDRLEAPGGRGVMLMRSFMTRIAYNAKGNAVELEKRRA